MYTPANQQRGLNKSKLSAFRKVRLKPKPDQNRRSTTTVLSIATIRYFSSSSQLNPPPSSTFTIPHFPHLRPIKDSLLSLFRNRLFLLSANQRGPFPGFNQSKISANPTCLKDQLRSCGLTSSSRTACMTNCHSCRIRPL